MELLLFILLLLAALALASILLFVLNIFNSFNRRRYLAGMICAGTYLFLADALFLSWFGLGEEQEFFAIISVPAVLIILLTYLNARGKAVPAQNLEGLTDNKPLISPQLDLFLKGLVGLLLLDLIFLSLPPLIANIRLMGFSAGLISFYVIALLSSAANITACLYIRKQTKFLWQLLIFICLWTLAGIAAFYIRTFFVYSTRQNFNLADLQLVLRLILAIFILQRLQRADALEFYQVKPAERLNLILIAGTVVLFIVVGGNLLNP
jgi:hypothetical protein